MLVGAKRRSRDSGMLDDKNLFPLRRQANPPTGVIKKEPVPQLREG